MKLRIVLGVLLLCTQLAYSQTNRYWVTGGDGNWNSTNNWSASSGGASGASIPNNNTFLAIFDANSGDPSVLINLASFNLQKFWITDSQSVTLTSSGAARTITIGDNANNSITGASVTNADFVVESGSTLTIIGESGPRTMTITQNNNANSQAIIIGTVQVGANGVLTKAANPSFTFNSGAIYNHNRDAGNIVTATWNAASTCNITGTTANPPGGLNQTFGDLNFNCSALTSPEIATPAGALLVQGNFSIMGTSAVNTMSVDFGGNNFTVNGTTTINANGRLTDGNNGGANLFVGLVTVNLNGQWNIPRPCTFRGGLTVNSTTFIATSTYTFDTNDQTISGAQSFSITNVVCGTAGRTLTNANINGLTIAGTLSGAGNFTNGTPVFQAVLYLTANADPISTLVGTEDFTSNNNTVSYSGAGAQTIGAYNFYNLTAGGGGTRTLVNGGTIGISGLFTPMGTYVTTGNTINFNGTGTQNIPAFTYNNITISGSSTKTLIGNVIVGATGIINLTAGVLDLSNFNLTVNNNAVNAIQGAFSSTNMIATSGTGYLERNAGATLPQSYPIGAGGYYSPATISALTTTSPTIRVRAIPTALNPSYINKYWAVTIPSGAITNATATFQYDPAELNGALPSISFSPDGGVSWQNPPLTGAPTFGANSFTITGTSTIAGWWTMGYKTYYSYQTGNWNISSTWTSDPSGTLQIGSTLPSNNDKVVILSGRTVTLTGDVSTSNLDVTINDGGYLNLDTRSFSNPLSALRGQGTLKLASANFPTVTTNTFINAGGGTVEYNVAINLPVAQIVYNNLTINTVGTVIQVNNITLNGNLYIQNGTYQINDNSNTRRRLIISGNVTVDNGAAISVGTGVTNTTTNPIGIAGGTSPFMNYYDQQSHRVVVNGDFTNNGTVRFTNLTYPLFNAFPPTVLGATSGFATVYFFGATDNALTCNGQTDFYNLVIDKGTDQTYELTINSSAYTNFRLFGANVCVDENYVINPDSRKALWIRTGTLILTGFVVIPSLTEGTTGGLGVPTSDFTIPANACLTIDGQNVVVLVTADDYRDINVSYGVAGGSGLVNGVGQGGYSGLKVLGKLIVNDGYLSTRESSGLIYSNLTSGQIFVNGGTLDAKQFDGAAGGLISYTQAGGLFTLRGRLQRTPSSYIAVSDLVNAPLNTARANEGSIDAAAGSFSVNSASNVFAMSAGTIRIYDATAVAGRVFDVLSSASNYNVTGGTLELASVTGTVTADAPAWFISSNAPVGNLLLDRSSGSSTSRLNAGYPLTVLKNLTVQVGDLEANGQDVNIGGDFTLQSGTTYSTGANTTMFNGSGTQTFTINTGIPLTLNKLTINKVAGEVLNFAGSQTTVNVNDNFRLVLGTLNDNGNTINVLKDVYNSGVQNGTGKIALIGTVTQVIDGNGVFSNIELNNNTAVASPISLIDNITINGVLTFSRDKLFNICTYNLKLNASASIVSGSGSFLNRYIQTSGNSGDGGVTKVYSSTTAFVFPIGAPTLIPVRAVKYTPATIGFSSAPTTYGSITIIPVGYEHPSTTVNGQSLTYFWRIKSSGFAGIPANSVIHTFVYDQSDVVGTEGNYIPSVYNRSTYTWNSGVVANINTGTNTISDWTAPTNSMAFLDGDYTAGDACFGTPQIYYSLASGFWSALATWTFNSSHTGAQAGSVPGANDIVIIGNNHTVSFDTPANYLVNPDTDPHSCASLQIEVGATLDTRYNPSSNFGMVLSSSSGNGTFRVAASQTTGSTFAFPLGDFTDFNINLGTTELYSTNPAAGTTYWLPNGILTYGNLILSPLGGSNIIFPNNNLTIYGNLITRGQNADSWFCPTWNVNYPTAPAVRIAKTITVNGDLDIQGGALIWYGNAAITQNFVVYGDVKVAPNSAIQVWAGATSQNLSIGGNLINNTVGTIAGGTTTSRQCNFTLLPVTFFGNNSTSISNTLNNPVTVFQSLTVNKGTSQVTTLTLDIGGTLTTPTDNWLFLQNGTFQYMRTNPNADFTISQGTAFTIPSTAGLYLDYSNTGNRNILIGNAASNTNDLFLNGKLTLIQGNVYVGPTNGTTNNNNDIEYSGGGASSIEIQGGTLVVNGQIRRSPSTSAGILSYIQSGGIVVINGNNAIASNAKLEVLNPGSVFNMSGATSTLTIVRGGGGASYGDLYLRPGSSSVTGGEIIFSQLPSVGPVVDVVQNYSIDANFTLNNLTVTGKTAATARNATVSLMVSPLVLDGILKLTNANSIFTSNSRNVTIKGDFNNNGTYNFGTNNTTFNGGAQSIIGSSVTNFYDLTVSSVSSLTINNSFTVNNNLSINSGTLTLSNKKLTLKGNIVNNSSYTDDNTIGGVSLAGTSLQQITGTGAFGRLELNNGFGARINNDISLQNDLVLTQGVFDLNQYLLTLGLNTNIGGAPFGQSKMIITDGVASSSGIRKFFNTTAIPVSFTYPIGVTGKYTPALLNITANGSVGYINIKPINSNHPAVVDPTQVLKYYWGIASSGISGFASSLQLQYLASDVQGVESNYVAAKLLTPGTYWSKATPGPLTDNVDEINHHIDYTIPAGTNDITGDYTAGINAALPDDVPSYISNANGDWTDNTIWDPIGASPPCPVGGPNGFNVVVANIVTANASYCFAYHTTINGTLKMVYPTFGHNLGTIDGNGKLYLEGGNLPAGDFTSFLDCAIGGTLEYAGSGSYTIIASQYNTVPYLFFTGSGTRTLPNKDLTICNRLVIDGPILDNNTNKRKLTILGTMERLNTGAFLCGSGANATVTFAGSALQTLGGSALGDFNGANGFNNLEINNSSGLNIGNNGVIQLSGNLLLTNGIINTSSTNRLYLNGPSTVTPSGGSSTSFVNGSLYKYIFSGSSFLYPVGKGTQKGHAFTLTSTAAVSLFWLAEYFTPNPTATSLSGALQAANTMEYWSVNNTSGAYTAKVKIGWDPFSDLTPLMTVSGISDMRVAEYNAGNWVEQVSTATGDNNNGDVATTNNVNISTTPINYTTASISSTKPRASLNPSGPVCGNAGIPVKFTSFSPINLDYTLDYTFNGAAQPTVNITSLPYTLPTPSPGTYKLTGFTYNSGANTGVVDPTIVTDYAVPTTSNAGLDQSLCGFSGYTLAGNNPNPYSGLWSTVSGSGGVILTPTAFNSVFNGISGNTYTLRWTISSGTCTSADDVIIAFPVAPQRPSSFISAPTPICQGSSGNIYTVGLQPGVTYNWTYSGTGATIVGTGNSVTLNYDNNATNGTLSVTATNGCGTSLPRSVSITVSPLPITDIIYHIPNNFGL
ncbi:MAG: hypothetical protein HOO91_09210 [Bacteroidales bacterium]|nr:hypothetical protein [Bacteroidales bacterium]